MYIQQHSHIDSHKFRLRGFLVTAVLNYVGCCMTERSALGAVARLIPLYILAANLWLPVIPAYASESSVVIATINTAVVKKYYGPP